VHDVRRFQNLALVGFMGTGKSSVGRLAAHELAFRFLDTDEMIEARAGKRISAIFQDEGEPAFRALECAVVAELAELTKVVISSGGGTVANADNFASLRSHALVIGLWASPEVIWQRTRTQSHRPLLQGPDPLARIRALLEERGPYYRQADVLVNSEQRSVREVAAQVVNHFRAAQNRSSAH
jgi:shikimate kinase